MAPLITSNWCSSKCDWLIDWLYLETVALLRRTSCMEHSQTSFIVLPTLIYSNTMSKLHFSREQIVTWSLLLNAFVNGAIQILLYCDVAYLWYQTSVGNELEVSNILLLKFHHSYLPVWCVTWKALYYEPCRLYLCLPRHSQQDSKVISSAASTSEDSV